MALKKKPSAFLRSLAPREIYDHDELAMDLAQECGLQAPWPAHTARRAQLDVMARTGRGAWMDTHEPLARVAYGFEVAEAVAAALAGHAARYEHLDARFQSAVFALEEKGL